MHGAAILLNAAGHAVRMESAAASPPLRELTGALARGDDAAWAEFHRDFGPGIFRYVLGGTRGDYDLAAEALQQTYLRVARYARPCEDRRQFEGWLRTLASSALNDCRRRRKSFWNLLQRREDSPEESVSDAGYDNRLFAALDTALTQVAPADRALLEQKYFAGADVRSLAERMGLSPKAVESRLTRARAELRRLLAILLSHHE